MHQQILDQNLNIIDKIHSVTERRSQKLQKVLDNSYLSKVNKENVLIAPIKKKIMLCNVKALVKESEILKEINETTRDNPEVLKGIFNIINTKDINGNTTITKSVLNEDSKTLEYLLKKVTSKIKSYNKISSKDKLYLHNILDVKNNTNKTVLQIAAESNIKCYNIILKYMKINYEDLTKIDCIANNMDLSDMEKIKDLMFNVESLIKKSYSLATFYYRDESNKIPSINRLKYNLITQNVDDSKKKLQEKLVKNLSKKDLEKILDTKSLCERLDDVDNNSADIILSRLKILTDDIDEITPIMQAAKNNDYKTLSLLINKVSSLKKTYTKIYNEEMPNYLDMYDSNYNTALSFAIKNQSVKCVKLLLKSGQTLGNDFEFSRSDSYIIQAINVKNITILKLIIKYYEMYHDKNDLRNYLLATTRMSNYMTSIEVAIKNGSLDCAILLHDKYNMQISEQFKDVYEELLLEKYNLVTKRKNPVTSIIERILKNIVNAILIILNFFGIIKLKS